jgi:hypothetical protein
MRAAREAFALKSSLLWELSLAFVLLDSYRCAIFPMVSVLLVCCSVFIYCHITRFTSSR